MPTPMSLAVGTELKKYFNNKQHSDITIMLADREIHAHRLILALSSKFFQAALEGSFQESGSRVFEMPDDDPDGVAGMLRYFYGLKPHDAAKEPGVYFDLKLYTVAGKYDVPELLHGAVRDVRLYLESHVYKPTFLQVVFDIFESVGDHDGHLHKVATKICRDNLKYLIMLKGFKEMLLNCPELSLGIVKLVADGEREVALRALGCTCGRSAV